MSTITREALLNALRNALEPLDYVHAMWEGGAAAFNRVDEWSDIDLEIDADDDRIQDVFAAAERALESLAEIELKYEIPQPTWHGFWQTFYRLKNVSPYLLIDFAVIPHNSPNKMLQPEIHNHPVIHFDKSAVVTSKPMNPQDFIGTLKARIETLRVTFPMFQILTLKELNRGNSMEAVSFYQGYTLRPLVEALGIKYRPTRHGFFTRYIHYDFPPEIVSTLEPLFFPTNADYLRAKRDIAEQLFWQTLQEIDFDDVAKRLQIAVRN
jgi:hypothetical protein